MVSQDMPLATEGARGVSDHSKKLSTTSDHFKQANLRRLDISSAIRRRHQKDKKEASSQEGKAVRRDLSKVSCARVKMRKDDERGLDYKQVAQKLG